MPFWAHLKNVETSQKGKSELSSLLPGHGVDTVKPVSLIREILKHLRDDVLVLDFFAGTGTTGHALFEANQTDGGRRRSISVQLPLPVSPDVSAERSTAEFCDSIERPRNLAEITKERLRRAGCKLSNGLETPSTDTGFRVFKLDSSNIRSWIPDPEHLEQTLIENVDHLKPDRTEQDLFFEVLLKMGIGLCEGVTRRTIVGKTVCAVESAQLITCLGGSIRREDVEALANGIADWCDDMTHKGDTTVVVQDSAFADDVAKTNLAVMLEQHGLKIFKSV